jgi:hypothetical protein
MMHEHVRGRLSPYLEGELSAREESALEAHLAECPPCSAELRALRRAIDLLHHLDAPALPSDIGGAVLERLRAGEAPRRAPVPWGRLAPFALAAGIVAVALLTPAGEAQAPKLLFAASSVPAPIERIVAQAPAALPGDAGIGNGSLAAQTQRIEVSPYRVCVARFRSGRPAGPDCAAWDAYLVGLASEDASRFSFEMRGMPQPHRQRILDRFSRFAAETGSAPSLAPTLRHSRDPQMVQLAKRVERRHNAPIRQASYDGGR